MITFVASAGERPPTRTLPPTVTPAAIVVGCGAGASASWWWSVVVVVGGGGGAVVVPVVVPSCASADGVPTSNPAESTPASDAGREQDKRGAALHGASVASEVCADRS